MSGIGSLLSSFGSLLGGQQVAEKEQQVPAQANSPAAGIPDGLSAEQAQQLINTQTPPASAANLSPQQIAQAAVLAQGVQVPGSEQVIQTPVANPAQATAQVQQANQRNEQARKDLLEIILENFEKKKIGPGPLQTQVTSLDELLADNSPQLLAIAKELGADDDKKAASAAEKLGKNTFNEIHHLFRLYQESILGNDPAHTQKLAGIVNEIPSILHQTIIGTKDPKKAKANMTHLLRLACESSDKSKSSKINDATNQIRARATAGINAVVQANPTVFIEAITDGGEYRSSRSSYPYYFFSADKATLESIESKLVSLVANTQHGDTLIAGLKAWKLDYPYFSVEEINILNIFLNAAKAAQTTKPSDKELVLKTLNESIEKAKVNS